MFQFDLIFYLENTATEESCKFYCIDSSDGFIVSEQNKLCLSYSKFPFGAQSKETAIKILTRLHQSEVLSFNDPDLIPYFVERTWPHDVDILKDFVDRDLGKFNIKSLMDMTDVGIVEYDLEDLEPMENFPEMLLNVGEWIEDRMTAVKHDSYGYLIPLFSNKQILRKYVSNLLHIFFVHEVFSSLGELMQDPEVEDIICDVVKDTLSGRTKLLGLSLVSFLGSKLVSNGNVPNLISQIKSDFSPANISNVHDTLNDLSPVDSFIHDIYSIFKFKLHFNKNESKLSFEGAMHELVYLIRERFRRSNHTIRNTAFSQPEIYIKILLDGPRYPEHNSDNNYILELPFSLGVEFASFL